MSGSPAVDLAARCADCLGSRDVESLAGLFAEDAAWELAFDLGEITGERRVVRGAERIVKFLRRLLSTFESTTVEGVQAWAVDDELAFVTFRSETRTRAGRAYGNRYLCLVRSRGGQITHWLEFFDPRPAEAIREEMATTT